MTNEQVDNGTVGVMDSNIQDEVDSLEEKVTFLTYRGYICLDMLSLTEGMFLC